MRKKLYVQYFLMSLPSVYLYPKWNSDRRTAIEANSNVQKAGAYPGICHKAAQSQNFS